MRKVLTLLSTLLLMSTGCTAQQPQSVQYTEELLGTYVTVTAYGSDDDALQKAVDAAFDRARALEQIFSPTIQDSELCAVNVAAFEDAVPVSEDFRFLTEEAQYYSQLSGGALNCTMGELIALWGIGTENAGIPAEDRILSLLPKSDNPIQIEGNTIRLLETGVSLHFGAVAKGYIADEMQEVLLAHGVQSAALSLGGNVLTIGTKPDGSAWKIGITDPFSPESIAATVSAEDLSVVTSGTYERYFEEDGILYHHILDPKTGYPADSGLASVTILAQSSLTSDALSTAVFVLGAEEGMALVESLPDVEALLITEDGEFLISSGMAQYELTRTENE